MNPGRLEWAGALAVGLLLRLVAAAHHAWWGDEAFVLGIARLPLGEAWGAVRGDLHPPLFPLLCQLWTALLGVGPVLSRGPALLSGVGMHAAAAFLAGQAAAPHRRVWATRAGLWGGALWGFLLVPGVELRHYGAAAAAAGLALAASLVVLQREDGPPHPRWALGAGLVLLVHLQVQGWLLVAGIGLVGLVRRRRDLVGIVLAAGLLGAPQLADSATKFLSYQERARPELGLKRLLGPAVQLAAGFRVANVTPAQLRADSTGLLWLACVGVALLLATLGLLRMRGRSPVQNLVVPLVVVAGGIAVLAPGGYQARYLALLGPPGLALVVAGLAVAPAGRIGLAALVVANTWCSLVVARMPVNPVHREDSRRALQWLAEVPAGGRAALLSFGGEALLAVEGRQALLAAHPEFAMVGVPARQPEAVAAAAGRGAPTPVRLVSSRQEYLDPAMAEALEMAMQSVGYRLRERLHFGDHLPAWEFER